MTKCKRRMPCEVYSRVVGYLRPVASWNLGKKQEFKDRKDYVVVTKQGPYEDPQENEGALEDYEQWEEGEGPYAE